MPNHQLAGDRIDVFTGDRAQAQVHLLYEAERSVTALILRFPLRGAHQAAGTLSGEHAGANYVGSLATRIKRQLLTAQLRAASDVKRESRLRVAMNPGLPGFVMVDELPATGAALPVGDVNFSARSGDLQALAEDVPGNIALIAHQVDDQRPFPVEHHPRLVGVRGNVDRVSICRRLSARLGSWNSTGEVALLLAEVEKEGQALRAQQTGLRLLFELIDDHVSLKRGRVGDRLANARFSGRLGNEERYAVILDCFCLIGFSGGDFRCRRGLVLRSIRGLVAVRRGRIGGPGQRNDERPAQFTQGDPLTFKHFEVLDAAGGLIVAQQQSPALEFRLRQRNVNPPRTLHPGIFHIEDQVFEFDVYLALVGEFIPLFRRQLGTLRVV